jgi:hypothetical protein
MWDEINWKKGGKYFADKQPHWRSLGSNFTEAGCKGGAAPINYRLFLINCLVFGSHTDRNDAFTGLGFRDWKKPINLLATNLVN